MAVKKSSKLVKKRWYKILAPSLLREATVGETFLADPEQIIGKKMTVSLGSISGEPQKHHTHVNLIIKSYDDGVFKYTLLVADKPEKAQNVEDWFTWTKTGRNLKNGKGYKDRLVIAVPDNARTGDYLIDLNLDCPGETDCSFAQLLITVEGE